MNNHDSVFLNLPLTIQSLLDQHQPPNDVSQLVQALRSCHQIQHPPRSSEKTAYLISQGIDPIEGFPVN